MVTTFSKYILDILVTDVLFQPSKTYMSADDDQVYIDKILNGDTNAFATLVNRYKNMVFILAMRILKNREEAEEVAQDAFVKIYKNLSGFKGDSKFSTWVYRITYNTCLDRIKTYKNKNNTVAIDQFTENHIKTLETAFDLMDRSDRQKSIKECLQKLPAEDNLIISLFYYDELSLGEISKVVGLAQNNVKVKLFRARKRLATILTKTLEPAILENYGQGNR